MEGMKNKLPKGSRRNSFSLQESASICLAGSLRITKMTTMATPPMGKLIKKHHLQLTLEVKAPPRSGPATLAIPKMEPNHPMYAGRFASGRTWTIIVIAPEKRPVAPIPAIARPIISAVELGAVPHTIEPSSKRPIHERKTNLISKKV